MLVLMRMEDEGVTIGDPRAPMGRVKVCRVEGGRVRLGFEFGGDVQIHRDEVAERLRSGERRRERAAASPPRPVVELSPRDGVARAGRLAKGEVAVLAWFIAAKRPLALDAVPATARMSRWSPAALWRLVEWGLVGRETGDVLRITEAGVCAAEAYGVKA